MVYLPSTLIVLWGSCLIFGGYLMYIHKDYWVGIPVFAFGTMFFWGFAYDGISFIKNKLVKQQSRHGINHE